MNKGIARATGDVIGFLNADDCYMHDGVLSRIAAQFSAPDTDACYADLVYVDAREPGRVVRYWKSRQYTDGLFEKGWMPAHPTFYARREAYQRFGGYDTRYRLQADFELTMRFLACRHIRAAYVPEVWVRMRPGGGQQQQPAQRGAGQPRSVPRSPQEWPGGHSAVHAAQGALASATVLLAARLNRAPQKILVTGASGFVGTALCRALVNSGLAVRRALRTTGESAGPDDVAVGNIGPATAWGGALEGTGRSRAPCGTHACAARNRRARRLSQR